MNKTDIIRKTIGDMGGNWGHPAPDKHEADANDEGQEYYAVVIQTLTDRVPDADLKTCADFHDLGANCCRICHTFYPHYEMHIEDLPDGAKAWICCSVHRALHGEKPYDDDDDIDLEQALGGGVG